MQAPPTTGWAPPDVGRGPIGRAGLALAAATGVTMLATMAAEVAEQRGAVAAGARLERLRRSPQWRGGVFRNRRTAGAPPPVDQVGAFARWFQNRDDHRPPAPVPLERDAATPAPGPRPHVTWLGHASALVEIDGVRILLDPVWSERCSPSSVVGPRRHHPAPVTLAELGRVDAVVISHDHYDHLDMATVKELTARSAAPFLVPLGIGAHLERWGVPPERIVECDWGDTVGVGTVEVSCVEAQHFSGRWLTQDETLWASWVLAGPSGRVFFSGDTGYHEGFADIAAAHGPFDSALMAVGAYDPTWRAIHMDPEEAVRATRELGSPLLVPIHWCTFTLAPHPWAEPVDRLLAAAATQDIAVAVPRVGQRVDVTAPTPDDRWWRA